MEPPAKRARLGEDTPQEACRFDGAEQHHQPSNQLSNDFTGHGAQNTGNFTVMRDFNVNTNQSPSTRTKVGNYEELLDSLRFDQMDDRHESIKKAHAKTCAWFLETEEYRNWGKDGDEEHRHNFLWIKGKPGAGKSTLMKFLLEQLREQMPLADTQVLLSFFFNARGHDLEKTTTGLYRSLLLQLLEARSNLQDVLGKIRIRQPWTIDSLKALLDKAMKGLEDTPLVILVDALDECEESQIQDMLSFFDNSKFSEAGFRICFASRHYPRITLGTAVDIVLEEQIGHSEDIKRYLNSALKIKKGRLAADIRRDVREKATGVFMWVVLVVDILNSEFDAGNADCLRERIQELPKDLHKLFRQILTRDNKNMDGLLLCMQWVLFARRPLTPKELYFAVTAGTKLERLAPRHADDITFEENIRNFILSNSKGLAESTKSSNPTVQLIHESVRDFLLKKDGFSKIRDELSTNAVGRSNDALKHCCLAYINMEALKNPKDPLPGPKQIIQKFPFLEYAVIEVFYHAEQAQVDNVSQQGFLANFPRSEWARSRNLIEKSKVRRYKLEVSLLYLLAEAGMPALIRAHTKRQSCFEIEQQRYGSPILAASATKSFSAIQTMLELEIERMPESSRQDFCSLLPLNLDMKDFPGLRFKFRQSTPLLHHLITQGDEKVALFYLLLNESQAHAKDLRGKTSLMSAAEKGFSLLSDALMRMGADIAAVDEVGQNALNFAILKNHAHTSKLLIDRGANVLAFNEYGESLLHIASQGIHVNTAKLLIDRDADIYAVDKDGQTPLHKASANGRTKIVKLLLYRDGQTPLHKASAIGHTEIAKLLLDRGANICTSDKDGQTPRLVNTRERRAEPQHPFQNESRSPFLRAHYRRILSDEPPNCSTDTPAIFRKREDPGADERRVQVAREVGRGAGAARHGIHDEDVGDVGGYDDRDAEFHIRIIFQHAQQRFDGQQDADDTGVDDPQDPRAGAGAGACGAEDSEKVDCFEGADATEDENICQIHDVVRLGLVVGMWREMCVLCGAEDG
ncbi:hypothetical protein F4777DRAFT_586415 [Nemania sp. FL0916]|nr:hypothetical protein F4777DRAFT_586415 [Nemania sp. FL0916]